MESSEASKWGYCLFYERAVCHLKIQRYDLFQHIGNRKKRKRPGMSFMMPVWLMEKLKVGLEIRFQKLYKNWNLGVSGWSIRLRMWCCHCRATVQYLIWEIPYAVSTSKLKKKKKKKKRKKKEKKKERKNRKKKKKKL